MRDPNRIYKFCIKLAEVWSKVPDWRFGQLIANLTCDMTPQEIFYAEDDKMLKLIEEYFNIN